MSTVTELPTMRARIDELVLIAKGLALEIEGARKQVSYIGEITQDLLKSVIKLRADVIATPKH